MGFPKSFLHIGAVAGVLFFAGCTQIRLDNGCYECTDHADGGFACVHDELIFLRVKMPESAPVPGGYLDWAGKYSVDDDGLIRLDMPHEEERNFKFYFELHKQKGGILVNDYGADRHYIFSHEKNLGTQGNFQPFK